MKFKSLIFLACIFFIAACGAFSKHKEDQAKIAQLSQKPQSKFNDDSFVGIKSQLVATGCYVLISVQSKEDRYQRIAKTMQTVFSDAACQCYIVTNDVKFMAEFEFEPGKAIVGVHARRPHNTSVESIRAVHDLCMLLDPKTPMLPSKDNNESRFRIFIGQLPE